MTHGQAGIEYPAWLRGSTVFHVKHGPGMKGTTVQKINVTLTVSDGDVAEIVAALDSFTQVKDWQTGTVLSDQGGVYVTTTAGDAGHMVEGEIYRAPKRGNAVHVGGVELIKADQPA